MHKLIKCKFDGLRKRVLGKHEDRRHSTNMVRSWECLHRLSITMADTPKHSSAHSAHTMALPSRTDGNVICEGNRECCVSPLGVCVCDNSITWRLFREHRQNGTTRTIKTEPSDDQDDQDGTYRRSRQW